MASTMSHLFTHGISHGDVYAHNTMVNKEGSVLFGDFGAASSILSLPEIQRDLLERVEVRAFGCLIEDLLNAAGGKYSDTESLQRLKSLMGTCIQNTVIKRPTFRGVEHLLAELAT
jgi:predicted unusual protein kinase regulating ubiquinone biosynthesis (AarF/ABC1/UbiB family)